MSDMVKRLKRNPERWAAMNMTAVMEGSPAQALFALEDAKADIATLAAELSRLSALVAEWQKAAEPVEKFLERAVPQPGVYIAYDAIRRLSQLKDTTNADK